MLLPLRRLSTTVLANNVAFNNVVFNKSNSVVFKNLSRSTFSWSDYPPLPLYHHEILNPHRDQVKGGPIVISHGMLGMSSNWHSLAKTMMKVTGRDVYIPDARNHGRSPKSDKHNYQSLASDLRFFLVDKDLNDVTLVGHSMGARTCMLLCLVDPSRVSRLAVVDATPIHPTPENGIKTMQQFLEACSEVDLGVVPFDTSYPEAKSLVDKQLKELNVNTVTRQWLVMNIVRDKVAKKFAWQFNVSVMQDQLETDLVKVPEKEHWKPFRGDTHFFGGALSGYIPYDAHDDIREHFPMARFDYVSEAGHFVHMDNPSEFMMKLLPWLNKYVPQEEKKELGD